MYEWTLPSNIISNHLAIARGTRSNFSTSSTLPSPLQQLTFCNSSIASFSIIPSNCSSLTDSQ